jgi:hypothetical protein
VDTADLARMAVTGVLFGAYFALWSIRPRLAAASGCGPRGRAGGIAGALTSVLGLSTGPCSVVGCGAPVLPVIGLAFAGLSSGTLALLSTLSRVVGVGLLVFLVLAVGYLGWWAAADTRAPARRPLGMR